MAFLTLAIAVACTPLTGCHSSKNSAKPKPKPIVEDIRRPHVKPQPAPAGQVQEALVKEARAWIGTPYVFGGTSYDGADCSGFLQTLYKEVADISLPRTTREQREYCQPVNDDERSVGDILFFSSKKSGGSVTHVGMYIGDNKMIHASSSRGVVEEDLSLQYYQTHYLGIGRVPMLAEARPVAKSKKSDAKAKKPKVEPEKPIMKPKEPTIKPEEPLIQPEDPVIEPEPAPEPETQLAVEPEKEDSPSSIVKNAFHRK